jgi:hypothetical protein
MMESPGLGVIISSVISLHAVEAVYTNAFYLATIGLARGTL